MKSSKFFQLLILFFIAISFNAVVSKAQPIPPDCDCNSTSLTQYCTQYCTAISVQHRMDTVQSPVEPVVKQALETISTSLNDINQKIISLRNELELWEGLQSKFAVLNLAVINKILNNNNYNNIKK